MLKAENISCAFNGHTILDNVSLDLAKGKVTALTGPNGAGKTTLFRILTGELRPGNGSIETGGRLLEDWPASEISRFRGALSQENRLTFPFTVLEVALLGRLPHLCKGETAQDHDIAQKALRLMDMEAMAERLFTTLSGGEKQRVQMARVFAQIWEFESDPGCLLMLDEPTANLDLSHQHTALRTARDFASKGAAVMVVLHDLNLAASYADEVFVLHRGRVFQHGPPALALRPEIIEEVFAVRAQIVPRPGNGGFFIATDPLPPE